MTKPKLTRQVFAAGVVVCTTIALVPRLLRANNLCSLASAAFATSACGSRIAPPVAPATSFRTPDMRVLVTFGEFTYYVRSRVEATLASSIIVPPGFAPVTALVIRADRDGLSVRGLGDTLSRFQQDDDVYQHEFASHGYLLLKGMADTAGAGEEHPSTLQAEGSMDPDLKNHLQARYLTALRCPDESLPEGPYIVIGRNVHQAWRVYPDTLSAFVTSVVPNDDASNAEQHLSASGFTSFSGLGTSSVAVPSRLYYPKSPEKPLNGLRISVKDNMHVQGLVTSLGNRAYAELYGTQSSTAQYVAELQALGAVVVGKTKLSAFAGSEVPPCQCVDYFPPWNARGDGYQGPSGSSSGAASSIGGYPWLDLSICTDTTGSMRHPAASHGVWGHKVTWGRWSMEGVVPACSSYDSFGLLSRTPGILSRVLSASGLEPTPAFDRILYPTDWYPLGDASQQRMNEAFLEILEDQLGVKHVDMSLKEEWAKSPPQGAGNRTLEEFLRTTGTPLNGYDNLHNFDAFRAEYRDRFGKPPYVSPSHSQRWENNAKVTAEQRENAVEQLQVFKRWIWKHVFEMDDKGESRTLMIVPHGRPGANYRDVEAQPGGSKGIPAGVTGPVFIASMMGAPQLVIPIGQNPYQSRVSQQEEFAPIVTTLVGAPGSDLSILEAAWAAMKKAGWPVDVLTGRNMFRVGDNERHAVRDGKL